MKTKQAQYRAKMDALKAEVKAALPIPGWNVSEGMTLSLAGDSSPGMVMVDIDRASHMRAIKAEPLANRWMMVQAFNTRRNAEEKIILAALRAKKFKAKQWDHTILILP